MAKGKGGRASAGHIKPWPGPCSVKGCIDMPLYGDEQSGIYLCYHHWLATRKERTMTEVPTYDEEILEKLRDISQDPKHKLWGDKWKAQREVVQEYYQKGVTDTEARYQGLVEGYMKLTKNEELVLTRLLLRLTDENGWLNDKWIDDASVHEIAVIHEIAARLRKG